MKKVVVWFNPNKNVYYHKCIYCHYSEHYTYEIGSLNSYGHIIVDIIPLADYVHNEPSLKRLKIKAINKCISFLKKL